MDKQTEARALDLFEASLEWPDGERADRLAAACDGDATLRLAVDRLIAADARASRVLATEVLGPRAAAAAAEALPPPARIGAYRVTGLLGRGGMGEVWRGERDDGLFEQTVAIKLTWPGLLGRDAAQWFDAERRILARLNHPNIARLYDGGVEPGGRSYFVMELVEGEAIDAWVRRHKLDERACRKLAWLVCRAVEHAHQHLIVHADLKPSNILVSAYGQPKLADFGIARLLLAEDTGGGASAAAALPLTRAYASPQRLAGAPPGIADDVYSLGVVFDELFAMAVPQPHPDLAAILAKARSADPEQRYDSVTALRNDLERFGRHEPVSARPRTAAYVFARLLRRNRLAAAFVGTAALALIATSIVMTLLYLRADEARRDADRRFAEVGELAHFMLFDLFDSLEAEPRSLQARREIASIGQRYLQNLAADRRASVDLRLETVEGLLRLAAVQGRPGSSNLGQLAEARANLDRAGRIAHELESLSGGAQRGRLESLLARIEIERARLIEESENRLEVALGHLDLARRHLDAATAAGVSQTELRPVAAQWQLLRAQQLIWQSRYRDGAAAARAAIALVEEDERAAASATDGSARARMLLRAVAESALGDALYYEGNAAGARQSYARQLELLENALHRWPEHFDVLRATSKARWNLGVTLMSGGDFTAALQVLDRATAAVRELRQLEPHDFDTQRMEEVVDMARAQALAGLRRHAEAIAIMQRGVATRRAAMLALPDQAARSRDYATALFMLADVYRDSGHTVEACGLYADGLAVFERLRRTGRIARNDLDYAVRLAREASTATCPRTAGQTKE